MDLKTKLAAWHRRRQPSRPSLEPRSKNVPSALGSESKPRLTRHLCGDSFFWTSMYHDVWVYPVEDLWALLFPPKPSWGGDRGRHADGSAKIDPDADRSEAGWLTMMKDKCLTGVMTFSIGQCWIFSATNLLWIPASRLQPDTAQLSEFGVQAGDQIESWWKTFRHSTFLFVSQWCFWRFMPAL